MAWAAAHNPFFVHGKHGKRENFLGSLLRRKGLLCQNSCVSRPALRNCFGGSPGAERHTKITPGEEARSATQPGVGTPPKTAPGGRNNKWKWTLPVTQGFTTRLRLCRPSGAGFGGTAHPRFPRPPGSVTGGYYCAALRARKCHCIFTNRISTIQFFATLKFLLSNQIKKK